MILIDYIISLFLKQNKTKQNLHGFWSTCLAIPRTPDTYWKWINWNEISCSSSPPLMKHQWFTSYTCIQNSRRRDEQVICRKSFPPRAGKSNPSQHVALKACSQSLNPWIPCLQAQFLPFVQESKEKNPSERTRYALDDVEHACWLTFSTIMQLFPLFLMCGWLVVCQFSLATCVSLASLVTVLI